MDHVLQSFCSIERVGDNHPEQAPCTEWPQFVELQVPQAETLRVLGRALFQGGMMDFGRANPHSLCASLRYQWEGNKVPSLFEKACFIS